MNPDFAPNIYTVGVDKYIMYMHTHTYIHCNIHVHVQAQFKIFKYMCTYYIIHVCKYAYNKGGNTGKLHQLSHCES